jgi:acetoacetyl-CoA synthetase
VRALWTELFAMPQMLEPDANFFELGGNSLLAARMLAQLGRTTGRALPVSALMEAPTIAQLAAKLERSPGGESPTHRVFPARAGIGRPVFLVHGLSGTVMECEPMLRQLRSARPVYGFQARGVDDGLAPHERVEDIAREYVRELRTVQPTGPYAIWGFSFGGLVALEMARLLAFEGDAVEHVGLVDTYVVHSLRGGAAWIDRARRGARIFRHLAWPQLAERIKARGRAPAALNLPPAQQRVHDAMTRALHAYRPGPFGAAPVVYLRADLPLGGYHDPLPEWRRVAGHRLRVLHVPGAHLDLVGPTSRDAANAIDDVLGTDAGDGGGAGAIALLDRLTA